MLGYNININPKIYEKIKIYTIIIFFNRFYLLPLYFYLLKKYTKNKYLKSCIIYLRKNLKPKLILILSSFIFTPLISIFSYLIFDHSFSLSSVFFALFLTLVYIPGLYWAYITLFSLWWIHDYVAPYFLKLAKIKYKS